ncbi:MAG: DUF484 family protein [Pseudomonadota bacterium]
MSTQPEYVDEGLTDEAVAEFLLRDPEFFERNSKLLADLRLPHAAGGTVSLVERQVSTLRQRELKLERQLKELIGVARDNDVLAAKIHTLAIQLLAQKTLADTVGVVEEAVRAGFSADHAVLVLFGDPDDFTDMLHGRFLRVVKRNDDALGPFTTFLDSSNPRCGQARDAQLAYLFHEDAEEIGSVVMLPLGAKSNIGFMAIGSHDKDRFHPGMSIDFVTRVGELVTEALKRF